MANEGKVFTKTYEVALPSEIAEEVLSTALAPREPTVPKTIGERVTEAVAAIAEANEYLETSKMAAIVADTYMRKLKKRGKPTVRVRADGTVVLRVEYDGTGKVRRDLPTIHFDTKKTDLPNLDELRQQAFQLGVDISDLGRAKSKIRKRLEAVRYRRKVEVKP